MTTRNLHSEIRAYIELIVKKGLRLDPGQDVILNASVEQHELIPDVVEECYRSGARYVWVEWNSQPLTLVHNRWCAVDTLGTYERWQLAKMEWRLDKLPAMLYLISDDPSGEHGIDQKKRGEARKMSYPKIKPFLDAMENRYQWCIAAVPGKKWAKKVFPGLSTSRAMKALWDAILSASRAHGETAANWDMHIKSIKRRCRILNEYHFVSLKYKGANGTNLTVQLMPESIFNGGDETDLSGHTFLPNIPSEEIFTTPKAGSAEGIVYATKPLSVDGQIIDNFSIRFENGRAVEVHAGNGQELLEQMITMDAGASMLGECAFVPCDSPINNTGILFFETLFDENAACHLALGRGFNECVKGFENLSNEELRGKGVNDSMIHVDFMIGFNGLDIDGILSDGNSVPIFRCGEWAADFA